MNPDWAVQHLQTIRTLMERAAIYRRALAPIMTCTGVLGIAAAGGGIGLKFDSSVRFVEYWLAISVLGLIGAYLLVRRQALKDAEPFWSPPTRRVTVAILPPLTSGLILSLFLVSQFEQLDPKLAQAIGMHWLPLAWMVLYGCALHAAGFFMPRGMKLFGWIFIAGGCVLLPLGVPSSIGPSVYGHVLMGLFFGILQLAYGFYLGYTEKRKNEA